jgi:hypothetical protein
MKYLVLFASLCIFSGCDQLLPKCGFWGGERSYREIPVPDRPIQKQLMMLGETRFIALDRHMYIKSVYSGNKDCREPDFKSIPTYTVRFEDTELADVSITVDNEEEGRFGSFPQFLRIQTKAIGSSTLTLVAKWMVHTDHDSNSYYETQEFEIEISVTP